MANHSATKKAIRSSRAKRDRNKYYHKTTRNAMAKLRGTTDKAEAEKLLSSVVSMIDKLSKNNVIHSNKASNLKSKLHKHVNSL